MFSWFGRPPSTSGNAAGISFETSSRSSDVLPSGHARDGSESTMLSICGVRPTPGNVSPSVSGSPRPSKPGWPSIQQSAALTAWAPAPSSPCDERWYWTIASSGAPT